MLVNGEKFGGIRNHEMREHIVPAGPVTVQVRIDWTGSRPCHVLAPGETAVLMACHAGMDFITGHFGREGYLQLDRVG